ncbi:MAG: hypothetical protein QGH12_07070 [SAR324 cluster bacterium]|nr:hypothetical protein [SAR324 cluster bacterium]
MCSRFSSTGGDCRSNSHQSARIRRNVIQPKALPIGAKPTSAHLLHA